MDEILYWSEHNIYSGHWYNIYKHDNRLVTNHYSRLNTGRPANSSWWLQSLKRNCRHFNEIFSTGLSGNCHFHNFRFSQWWKFRQNDKISISVVNHNISKFLAVYTRAPPGIKYTRCTYNKWTWNNIVMWTNKPLDRKCRHFDVVFVIGCTGSCQNDDVSVSVTVYTFQSRHNKFIPFPVTIFHHNLNSMEISICFNWIDVK